MTTLKLLRLTDVCRLVGYDRKTVRLRLARDEADGTPGLRFPVPLKKVGADAGEPDEWAIEDVVEWREKRKQC